MDWVFLALAGTASLGASNILDSHLLNKRMSFQAFLMLLAVLILVFAVVLCFLFPLPAGVDNNLVLFALGQGIVRSIAVVLLMYVLKMEEVSRAVPVVYVYPIFVALLAMPLLGESLNAIGWFAVITVVAGAVLISVRRRLSGLVVLNKPFLMLLLVGILFALTDIAGKHVLFTLSFFNLFWLSAFVMSGVFFVVSVRPKTFKQLKEIKQPGSAIGLLILDEVISVLGVLLGYWALQLGPVALVSTITAARPIFVVLFAVIVSRAAPMFVEFAPGRSLLAQRLVATAMIVGGIAIIYLT